MFKVLFIYTFGGAAMCCVEFATKLAAEIAIDRVKQERHIVAVRLWVNQ